MTPDKVRIAELEKKVTELETFMKSLKSAAMIDPQVPRAVGLRLPIVTKGTVGNTTGMTKAVNEAGVSTYNVADVPDGSLILLDNAGNEYKVGYYT